MTPKYWLRIIAGMLAIFAVGMLIRAGLHKGRSVVTDITRGSGPITVPLLGIPFRLGDVKLGSMQKLRIERSAPKLVSGFHLYATLADTITVAQFDDCRLTVTNPDNIDEHTSFRCATVDDSASQEMVPFGSVTLQPSGREFVLLIPESVRRDIQNDPDGLGLNSADSTDINADSVTGSVNLRVNGRKILSAKFDSTGGQLVRYDSNGKEVVSVKVQTPSKRSAVKRP